jgi:hypothetical protein
MKTPRKPVAEERQPTPQLLQAKATSTPTPHKSKSLKSLLPSLASRTPNNRTPIKPAGQEMHPAHHHASTAKILDEARWLGFQALDAHTAAPKAMVMGQATPSKTPVPATASNSRIDSSPDFRFRFKSPFAGITKSSKQAELGLSPSTRDLLRGVTGGDTPRGSRPLFGATEFSTKADMSPQRKKAEAKGKMGRFSDIHLAQFKKMDSIANHPSAFRADPGRFKPVVGQPLKKSPSKPDLAEPEPSKLKRTQSKIDLTEPVPVVAGGLKRTQSNMVMSETTSKIPASSLKRTQSKMDLTGSSLPRSQSTVRLVPPTRDERSTSCDGPADGMCAHNLDVLRIRDGHRTLL